MRKGHTISFEVEEMVAKEKYIKGCHILAEITTQLNQNDRKPLPRSLGSLFFPSPGTGRRETLGNKVVKTQEKCGHYRKFYCFGFNILEV